MRQIRRVFTAVLVLLGATVIVPAFGGTVSAHHSNIAASAVCDGTVSWTATSWATGAAGTNADIRVTMTVGSTTTAVQNGAFNNANNYQFSGTFAWPAGATTVTVTSTPYATWGNGTVSNTGGSVTVTKPTDCPTVFSVVAVCNSVDVNGAVTTYWFDITNTESTPVTVAWNDGGTTTVPAGQTVAISSTTAPLVLMHNSVIIAQAPATETICTRTVVVTKELVGAPGTGETYTVRVSRLVGATYQTELTIDINAGESKTITLPSTLDPAGITYTIDEINAGTASTGAVAPNALTLAGHLGETVDVVVTNGYASVQIDKSTSSTIVVPGGKITYTLQGTNTGGLTLDPVVMADRLPPMVSLASATVAGGAGECHLAETTRPQLLSCTMNDALAPGGLTSVITVVVDVDSTAVAGSTILNQAMIHGAFTVGAVITPSGTDGPQPTCNPVIPGTVCDLSSQVGVPVAQAQVASSPPVPTSGVLPTSGVDAFVVLPATGTNHVPQMLVLAFGSVLLGSALLMGRRRIGVR